MVPFLKGMEQSTTESSANSSSATQHIKMTSTKEGCYAVFA
uniref:Uncharacterized protein n=1 Tax=Nelumbo nucifera TaxID=4432 RepID=A0A822Z1C2_NELNU|nr:TPA_asm: hypothetical protein HUJ06_008112 [Nelumbo nucifera]